MNQERVGNLKQVAIPLEALKSSCSYFSQYTFVLTSCGDHVTVVTHIPTGICLSLKFSL